MDYEEIYEGFYAKYYAKIEILIKNYLIKQRSVNLPFFTAINKVNHYFVNDFINKYHLHNNENLEKLYQIFCNRRFAYSINAIEGILEDQIKKGFDKIDVLELPIDYNYSKLIKEIALLEVEKEISRLLSNNLQLLKMFYELNEFDEFEIRRNGNLSIEDFPIYRKLATKLYPKQFANFIEDVNFNLNEVRDSKDHINSENKNPYPLLFLNLDVYNCFLEYQKHIIDFYIDFSYLKKRMEFEKLIHHHKDNDFMKIVFEEIKLISEKKYNEYYVNGKLKSLTKSFSTQRNNNFNIVFKDLLN
ncbi:hypothetical protein [Flavobacterium crassostreae]|uniref:Uncharacterized protein n=1 Tax=Flavobacterium crassostreae TaxID=1763534 RepID=A0A1B9E8Z2_9FLAO|nr:hypothetical protein [Flavobacterium crassostreae]OCB78409.1 hypothetical protein LPBF_02460 [Flavobacterium crassostreae]